MLIAVASVASEYPAAHIASPDRYQVLLDNAEVLVLKMVLKPGEADVIGTITITRRSISSMVAS